MNDPDAILTPAMAWPLPVQRNLKGLHHIASHRCEKLPITTGGAGSRQTGFTLLEIMVVVILISITVTLVSINLDRDLDQVARQEARRFAKLLEHLREESILTGKVYAIEIDEQNKSYRFLEPGQKSSSAKDEEESGDEKKTTRSGDSGFKWTPVNGDDLFRKRLFPEYLSVRFDALQGTNEGTESLLIVHGLGDVTPFQLSVAGDNYLHVVKLDDNFNVIVDQVVRDDT